MNYFDWSGQTASSQTRSWAEVETYAPLLDKYSRQATSYDRRWNIRWGEATLRAAIEAVPWSELSRVLDVGCGTGELERAVRSRLRSSFCLMGADISLAMLQRAHQKLRGVRGISWANAPAESLPFVEGAFDAVVCNNSFHYYRDPVRVLEEFRRVLRPDGQLILVDWCGDFWVNRLSQWALWAVHRLYLHRYALARCYGLDECETLLTSAGFRIDSAERLPIEWGWGVMVVRARC
jgi:ubiquinone/menaquinone biosynthesis C-methylase UbiE